MTHGGQHDIDPQFTALPLRALADAAMQQAADLGAGHADFRAEQLRSQTIGLSDGNLETLFDASDVGLAVRVVVDGTWGFAATVDLTPDAAAQAAREAIRHGLRCPHEDITQCPNFNAGITARLVGQPLSRSHQQLHGQRFHEVPDSF